MAAFCTPRFGVVSSRTLPLAALFTLVACSDEPAGPTQSAHIPSAPAMAAGQAKPARLAYVYRHSDENYAIWTVNPDGTDPVQVTPGSEGDEFPAWSPDRKKLVFTRGSGAGRALIVMNANGTNMKPLGVNGFRPRWSPDGKKIIYGSYDASAGNHNIFTINADGTNIVRLTDDPAGEYYPTFSADGQKVAFLSSRTGFSEVYVMNADGTQPAKITSCGDEGASCQHPSWSPVPGDQRILYQIPHPVNRVRTINADGSGMTDVLGPLSQSAREPVWSPDATRIAFEAALLGDASYQLWTARLNGSEATRVTFVPQYRYHGFHAWAR